MKIKNLIFSALVAASILTSCSKEDIGNKDFKSVSVNLANVIGTRSSSNPVADQSKVGISNFQIFFADGGGNLYKGKKLDQTNANHYFTVTSLPSASETHTFHYLPATVTKVIVVGNQGSEISATKVSELETKTQLDINSESPDKVDALSLYGESGLTKVGTDPDDDNTLYQASVTVAPRIARLEIESFECDFGDSPAYSQIGIERIALNNYYGGASLVTGIVSGDPISTGITNANVWSFFANLTDGKWDNDALSVSLTPQASKHSDANLAYHFFPNETVVPQLVAKMTGVPSEGGEASPLYLATKNFLTNGTALDAADYEAGKIYRISFKFPTTAFSLPEKCIEVTVSVASWQVYPVTPEF